MKGTKFQLKLTNMGPFGTQTFAKKSGGSGGSQCPDGTRPARRGGQAPPRCTSG